MLIVVPAVPDHLRSEVVPALVRAAAKLQPPPEIRIHILDPRLERGYAELLREVWGRTILLIEHDVVVHQNAVLALDSCPRPWCVVPYDDHRALGCARFRPTDLEVDLADLESAPWWRLDQAVYEWLAAAGHQPHLHPGLARHLR